MLLTKTPLNYGASQNGIAKRLGISRKKVAELLKSAAKIQVAQFVSSKYYWRAKFEQEENMGQALESGFVFSNNKAPLKLQPYRYYPAFQLSSQKHLRYKLNTSQHSPAPAALPPHSQDIMCNQLETHS